MSGMDSSDEEFDAAPTSRDALWYSLSALVHDYGQTDSVLLGVAVNLTFVVTFGLLFLLTSGWLSWLAAGIAALSMYPIIGEVLRL